MDNKNTLNGFEAILDKFIPNPNTDKDTNVNDDILDGAVESPTDEELEAMKGKKPTKIEEPDEPNNDDEPDDDVTVEEPKKAKKVTKKVEIDDEPDDDSTDDDLNDNTPDDNEADIIVNFFDSLSEKLGWDDVEENEKPKTAEDLIEYFKEVIEENSTPQYASEEVEKLDAFVHNGGNLRDYFNIDAEIDLDNISIEDDEANQKLVLKEFLKEKGFNKNQIEKKLNKYEDAGLLEDEAEDALEALREIKNARKEELLANQEKRAREAQKQQQEFFTNVVAEIKSMDSIYGIDIPEKDKRSLLEYIFKPDSDGRTRYQKDYAKSLKNLITSAYFTMKGDTLIDIAKKKGKKDALDNFKNSLNKNSGVTKRSKRQILDDDSNSSIWDAFTRKLRA